MVDRLGLLGAIDKQVVILSAPVTRALAPGLLWLLALLDRAPLSATVGADGGRHRLPTFASPFGEGCDDFLRFIDHALGFLLSIHEGIDSMVGGRC